MRFPTCLRHRTFRRACRGPHRPAAHRCRPWLDPLEDRLCPSGVSFGPAINWPAGPSPRSVAVADFNEDGRLDLAVVNFNTDLGTVSVLLGNGSGGFAAPVNFATGRTPVSVAVGDFNGDGRADLAVVNANSDTVSVLLGDGTGNFGRVPDIRDDIGPNSVAVGDFNGDGRADLAVANFGSNTVSVLLGNGSGGFAAPVNLPAGDGPYSVAVGDFNGDGRADLTVANSSSNTVSVLLGDGTGNFGRVPDVTVNIDPLSVAVGDFNGDGRADLATANEFSDTVSVLIGNGSGGFAVPVSFATGDQPVSVAVEDFNGDGRADLAVANFGSNTVSVLLGNGSGGFAAPVNFAAGDDGSLSVAVGDFNGDGRADLAVANFGSDTVSVLLNTTPTNQPPLIEDQGFGVAENSPSGTVVGTVAAHDPDAGQALSYQITAGNTSGVFAINSNTGQITVANGAALDFETTRVFILAVKATDNGDPAKSSTATITIRLNDVNENTQSSSIPTQAVAENSTLTFSGASGNDFSGLVPDTGAALIEVRAKGIARQADTGAYRGAQVPGRRRQGRPRLDVPGNQLRRQGRPRRPEGRPGQGLCRHRPHCRHHEAAGLHPPTRPRTQVARHPISGRPSRRRGTAGLSPGCPKERGRDPCGRKVAGPAVSGRLSLFDRMMNVRRRTDLDVPGLLAC